MQVAVFTYRGYRCEVRKNECLGTLCGYVHLKSEKHPLLSEDVCLSCHGGISYREIEGEGDDAHLVVGFDCAHGNDLIPIFSSELSGKVYRNQRYVRAQLNQMVDQIVETWGDEF